MRLRPRNLGADPGVIRQLTEQELQHVSGGVGDGATLCGTPPFFGSKPGGGTEG